MTQSSLNSWALVHGQLTTGQGFFTANLLVQEGRISYFQKIHDPQRMSQEEKEEEKRILSHFPGPCIDASGLHLFPGFVDSHVHFRQPGQEEKETIKTGSLAAAHGGYTLCCPMPNLSPVPDSLENLRPEWEAIRRDACIHLIPFASISRKEAGSRLSDMEDLAPYVAGFSDDGVGLNNPELMRQAMETARSLGKVISAHEEEKELVRGGVIHEGTFARLHGLPGNPPESEYRPVQRDLALAEETGAPFHICHISSALSVAYLRQALQEGADVSGETAPHYLLLNENDLEDDGRFRMNPPIRSPHDQETLRQALKENIILNIATDHAPHTAAEKAGGLLHSLNGVVGLETAFPLLYSQLVRTGFLRLEELVEKLTAAPLERFRLYEVEEARPGLGVSRGIKLGEPADLTLFDLEDHYRIDPADFLSKGKASPFSGQEVYGRCLLTLVGGQAAYYDKERMKGREFVYESNCI